MLILQRHQWWELTRFSWSGFKEDSDLPHRCPPAGHRLDPGGKADFILVEPRQRQSTIVEVSDQMKALFGTFPRRVGHGTLSSGVSPRSALRSHIERLTQKSTGPRWLIGDREAHCGVICTRTQGKPVCGSDGRSYDTGCDLQRARCKDRALSLAHRGRCRGKNWVRIDQPPPPPAPTSSLERKELELRDAGQSKCRVERGQALEQAKRPQESIFIPECKDDGSFSQVQCHTLTGYCWCVTSDGKPISGSSAHNRTPVCSGSVTDKPPGPPNSGRKGLGAGVVWNCEYGREGRGGLVSNLTLGSKVLRDWRVYSLSIDEAVSKGLLHAGVSQGTPPAHLSTPAFYAGSFSIPSGIPDLPQDTYVQFPNWGKGQLWINGFNLGRYWPSRGPQVTLYVPVHILSTAAPNNVTVLELESAPCSQGACTVEFTHTPILNATVTHRRRLFNKEDLS
ncbi:hypothetical protein SKAU_G00333510 [Synaphobranchus kaupii]|uniref:Beta-galactosidase n=1 Tax=Synaphobranchus kaupii TaxID=118154 RepID=A0A9Q1ELK0_SYNKA|nr:hypothetical protein SKAU_G00333510 [Synaphobranchus kaupii]